MGLIESKLMIFAPFLLQTADNLPTFGYLSLSGLTLALLVFAATYFHRQVGLITLMLVGLICAGNFAPDVFGQNYAGATIYFGRATFALSIILFFAAILLKRFVKKKKARLN